jgi:hypothetical protein
LQCYEKNEWWASCMDACDPDEVDPYDNATWSCTILSATPTPTMAPTPVSCSDPGEDCRDTKCCTTPGFQCYEKNEWWASCMDACDSCEVDSYDDLTWSCTILSATCADDDAQAVALAADEGYTISGCADVKGLCGNPVWGSTVQTTCPATCGLCCADSDAEAVALAADAGYTICGCADVKGKCGHPVFGSTVKKTCPATCGSCTVGDRRLVDGEDVRQKTQEVSNSDTSLFYP